MLTPVILQMLELGLQIAPPLIAAAKTEFSLLSSGTEPTPEQRAAIDAALEHAHVALQGA